MWILKTLFHFMWRMCFNRYMVECELLYALMMARTMPVLIDTWWNVNSDTIEPNIFAIFVLIDTWWNVNSNPQNHAYCLFGFNRYMVECECWLDISMVLCVRWVLIDTWWNVNFSPLSSVCLSLSFNRYMVECELTNQVVFNLPNRVLIDTWWNVNTIILVVPVSVSGF